MAVTRLYQLPPGAWPGSTARSKTHLHRRQVAPAHVVRVTAKIFRGEFPVARNHPLHAPDDLDAALAAVEKIVQIQAISPRYSNNGGASESKVAKSKPL